MTTTPEDYFNFLMSVFQTITDSNSNPEVVYPLLENNQNKLDETLAELLSARATSFFTSNLSPQAVEIAGVIFEFSRLITNFPFGNRKNNLEIAIKGYETITSIFTLEAFPVRWAATQNNLGNAYRNRIRGEKAENIEKALAAFNHAKEVYTKEAFPVDWAMTQNNLGNAYCDRIRGE